MAQLLVLVDLIGVLLLELLFLADIRITQDAPATVMPGSETKVTVTVEKGDLSGFAKLQIDLPEGFTCTAIETKGASFTFSDQKAKFIWMALPAQPSFKVSYNLVASATAAGQMPINGRFSYILDNERRTYDLATTTVTVMGDPAVAAATPAPAAPAAPAIDPSNDVVSASGAAPVAAAVPPPVPATPGQGPGGVTVERKVTLVSASELLVEVRIQKGDIRGFGKLQENLPPGFTPMEKNSAQAIFTTQDRIVKFVWLNLPAEPELKVAYKLRANGLPDGDYSVAGEFGYLLNDETQRVPLGVSTFTIGNMAFSALQQDQAKLDPTEAKDTNIALPEKVETTDAARATDTETRPVATRPDPSKGVPAPEKGIAYKVQITAAHREVGREYFAGRHRFHEPFSIERHEGWIKYTTGSFGQYRDARDKRTALVAAGHELPGPFVTAYNNGVRITVQEALMLSGQSWVQ
ncbi:MAG: hypothetical protein IT228_13695 [Flavobacteriales bacterium]|nr:hypothetical protein [Flavobacteriales bacterium]MCC6578388.1 hypothetical protein [Flavobacteriales bacterium]NUQ15232.1 hypothetical protein [Flavobacteriales bacterium]